MSDALLPYNPNTCGCCACPDFIIEVETKAFDGAQRYGYAGFQAGEVVPPAHIGLYKTLVGRGWHRAGSTIGQADYRCTIRDWLHLTPTGLNQGKIWPVTGCWNDGNKYPIPPPSGGACAPTLLTTCADGPGNSTEDVVSDSHVTYPPMAGERNPHGLGESRLLNPISLDDFFQEVLVALEAESMVTFPSHPAQAQAYRIERRVAEVGRENYLYLRRTRFRFKHPVPATGGYRVTWTLRYDPMRINFGAGGGDPAVEVDTEPPSGNEPREIVQSYQWNGTVPGGYDEGDDSTWPVSFWFEVPIPPLGVSGRWRIKHLVDVFYDIAASCVPPEVPEMFADGGEVVEA